MERAPRGFRFRRRGFVLRTYCSHMGKSISRPSLQEEPTAMDFYGFSFWKSAQ